MKRTILMAPESEVAEGNGELTDHEEIVESPEDLVGDSLVDAAYETLDNLPDVGDELEALAILEKERERILRAVAGAKRQTFDPMVILFTDLLKRVGKKGLEAFCAGQGSRGMSVIAPWGQRYSIQFGKDIAKK